MASSSESLWLGEGMGLLGKFQICLGLGFNRPDGTLCFVLFDEFVKSKFSPPPAGGD